jgi:hypothetical protein
MFIKFLCVSCGHKLKADAKLAGKRARCTRCSRSVTIPGPEANQGISALFVAARPPRQSFVNESVFSIWLGGVENPAWFNSG